MKLQTREVAAMPTHMQEWWLKDGVSELCAQSQLLAGVVTHVLHDGWERSQGQQQQMTGNDSLL